ncbi:MAG: deoxyribodipyrimidine photo-lyase [Candidatus Bathyarchaeota archaeon]|nr:deoxyribodipyrimidine photo-lyase [Candidatus Bathyarchaeota archaeon]
MIASHRIQQLNDKSIRNREYVLYWMQSSQRIQHNLALEYAVQEANKLNKPLTVFFGIKTDFPEANRRHFHFMLQGLNEAQKALQDRGIKMVIEAKSPEVGAVELAKDACVVVVDRGYLKINRSGYRFVAQNIDCALVQVEDNVVVPVKEASDKEEYSAATLRPKILKKKDNYLTEITPQKPKVDSTGLKLDSLHLDNVNGVLDELKVDSSVDASRYFQGGTNQAIKRLDDFLKNKLPEYPLYKKDPTCDYVSNLSPYLHFGQISPLHIARLVQSSAAPEGCKEAFLEELIVRRELAINYVTYNPNYDTYEGIPKWAKDTLARHQTDRRDTYYYLEALENAETYDAYWNAAQQEMRVTGKMHGYMRMYWGKKILEWSPTPQEAFERALYLNNKYELDGRDPNGYAGVAWCFGKHDRPWGSRPIFGAVRYMNSRGLERKFDVETYVRRVAQLQA